jgi:Tfp pilus assembly protein FimT
MILSTRPSNSSRRFARQAMTLIELLVVIVMTSLILMMVAPRLRGATTSANVHSASADIATRITIARQSAIRRGRDAVFHYSGTKAWTMIVNSNGTMTALGDTVFLTSKYGVSMTPSVDSIRYNARGFANLGSSQTFQLSKSGVSQTVCVTAAGLVLQRGCTL